MFLKECVNSNKTLRGFCRTKSTASIWNDLFYRRESHHLSLPEVFLDLGLPRGTKHFPSLLAPLNLPPTLPSWSGGHFCLPVSSILPAPLADTRGPPWSPESSHSSAMSLGHPAFPSPVCAESQPPAALPLTPGGLSGK